MKRHIIAYMQAFHSSKAVRFHNQGLHSVSHNHQDQSSQSALYLPTHAHCTTFMVMNSLMGFPAFGTKLYNGHPFKFDY